jgi:hypothetical protein
MQNYYIQYDATTGIIYPLLQESAPATTMPFLGPYPQDTASMMVVMAYNFPTRYKIQNGQLAEQPYFTMVVTAAGNEYTITATLNNPPTIPLANVSVVVAGSTLTVPVTDNVATVTLAIHPSMTNELIMVAVSATGCVGATANVGTGTGQDIGQQIYTPAGGVPTVDPVGAGGIPFLETYWTSQIPAGWSIGNLFTAMSLILDGLYNQTYGLVEALNSSLSTGAQNGLTDIQTNLLPKLSPTLGTINPTGTAQDIDYAAMLNGFEAGAQYLAALNNDLETIPNLEW